MGAGTLSPVIAEERRPNSLVVANTFSNDSSIITLSSNTARDLQLCHGSTVLVKGEKGKHTLLVILEDNDLEDSSAKVN